MALFFDKSWFDRQLEGLGKSHEQMAEALGLPLQELAAVWKDQRELSAQDVEVMASFLRVSVAEIANRAGVSTPLRETQAEPKGSDLAEKLRHALARIDRLEQEIEVLKGQISSREK